MFKKGDIVRLKHTGIAMLVTYIDDDNCVSCFWYGSNGAPYDHVFDPESLVKVVLYNTPEGFKAEPESKDHCPSCGTLLTMIRGKVHCAGCGWKADPAIERYFKDSYK